MLRRSSGRSREVVACENRTGGRFFFLFISRRDPFTSNVRHEIFAGGLFFSGFVLRFSESTHVPSIDYIFVFIEYVQ